MTLTSLDAHIFGRPEVIVTFAPQKFDDIRYWRLPEMRRAFARTIGPARLSVDAYFGLGIQASDVDLLPWKFRVVVQASTALRRLSRMLPWMRSFADSIYVTALREGAPAVPGAR